MLKTIPKFSEKGFCCYFGPLLTRQSGSLYTPYTCHENNYFLHEISVIFHEPTILLRAQTALSVKTQSNSYDHITINVPYELVNSTSNISPTFTYITSWQWWYYWFRWNRISRTIGSTFKCCTIFIDSTSTPCNFDISIITISFTPRILDWPVINAIFSTPSNNKYGMVNVISWISKKLCIILESVTKKISMTLTIIFEIQAKYDLFLQQSRRTELLLSSYSHV